MYFPTTTFQVLEITDGSAYPQWNVARENALINLAGIASDAGDKDAAVAAYQTILRQVVGRRALLKSERETPRCNLFLAFVTATSSIHSTYMGFPPHVSKLMLPQSRYEFESPVL